MKCSLNSKILAVAFAGAIGALVLPYAHAQQQQEPKQTRSADQQRPKEPTESNPFPTDTNNVPVMPNANTAAPTPAPEAAPPPSVPSDESDPVRSPDDPLPDIGTSNSGSSSSNSSELQRLLQPPPDEGKHGRSGNPIPEHHETAKEDLSVGNLYLSDHDWRGALSRFESALVLDPENPDVYWGMAECQRHMGQLAQAKANYEKVMEYDPGSRHAKDAKKILKRPEMASVK